MIGRWLDNRRNRQTARDDYSAAEKYAETAQDVLADSSDPQTRAHALRELAVAEQCMGMHHDDAFRFDRGQRDSHVWSACLYRALATVEEAVAGRSTRILADERIEDVACRVLDQMADHEELDRRAGLLEDLYDAVYPLVGGQVAELLWCLPSPGMVGWQTAEQRQAWVREAS